MATTTKYLPTERLGSGPTCDVFLGRDVGGLNRRVAIKQLREDVRGHASRREAFFAAAEKWSQFEHENLVTLFDLDRAEGCIIYEPHPLSGKQMIAKGGMSPAAAAETLAQTAAALGYIHNHGLLHLNIKPSNILFDQADRAHLIDGRCYDRDRIGELPLPTGGQKYLAPEMIDPALGQIGPSTDIYCLGFVILEFLLGPEFDDLFRGVGDDAVDADRNWLRWHAARDEPLPSLNERLPALSPELERVLHRMVNKDPLQRYHSVVELLDELRPVLAGSIGPPEAVPITPARPASDSGIAAERPRPAPAPLAGPAEQPKMDDIPNRPSAPVVIRFLGCDSEMVGVNKDFFTLGDAPDCDVQFPTAMRRDGQTVFRLGRAAEGWRLNCPAGITYYVNQQVASSAANLRSGDIIRISPGGPGLQFTILNQNAEPLSKLAARYAPRLVQPAPDAAPPQAAPPALVTAGNNAQRAAPSRPVAAAPAKPSAAPAKPAVPPPKPTAAPAPPARPHAAPARPTAQQVTQPAAKGRLAHVLDYKNWSKSTKNWVILVVSLVTMGLVIGLWPASEPEANESATSPSESATKPAETPPASETTTSPSPNPPPETGSS
jgi:serine/threonine-protein kinase